MNRNSNRLTSTFALLLIASLLLRCTSPEESPQDLTSKTILAIFAHPDDEATVSPVLARYASEGVTVYLAIATDGRLGITDHAQIPAGDSLAAVRTQELKCAAEQLGIEPPIQFGLEDQLKLGEGYGAFTQQIGTMREKVKELFQTLKPDVVITWGPSGWTGHPDHRLVGSIVTEVFQSQPWEKNAQLYYSAIPAGNLPADSPMALAVVDSAYLTVKVPIREEDYEKARNSWHCHKSQYTPETIEGMHALIKASLKGTAYFQPLKPIDGEKKTLF